MDIEEPVKTACGQTLREATGTHHTPHQRQPQRGQRKL